MTDISVSAYIFSTLTSVVILFQLALALGAPLGEMAMGGKFPGRFPPQMRIVALIQVAILVMVTLIVLIRAGLVPGQYSEISETAIWFVVAFCIVGVVLNTITPSKKERIMWAPVTIILLICVLIVANS
ncbi:MAG: hypothetical protein ACJASL_004309 [Paraglaciecola sp.]|jgi:hypothetical protein